MIVSGNFHAYPFKFVNACKMFSPTRVRIVYATAEHSTRGVLSVFKMQLLERNGRFVTSGLQYKLMRLCCLHERNVDRDILVIFSVITTADVPTVSTVPTVLIVPPIHTSTAVPSTVHTVSTAPIVYRFYSFYRSYCR